MKLPDVNIKLGNGNLGRSAATTDGVAGMVLTGKAVAGKLELNRHYQLSSTQDLTTLGVTAADNALLDKEVRAFYAQAGESAELHIVVVSDATTLTQMCAAAADSPLTKLIEGAVGRIRIAGVNKIAPADYEPVTTQFIDGDAVTAAAAAQQCLEGLVENQKAPVRMLMPAPAWTGSVDEQLFKPAESSYNRVRFVLASDDAVNKTAAIGQILGRNAVIDPQQSDARVKSGAIASDGWFTNGKNYKEMAGVANTLHEAGYTFYRTIPTRNGCYLNDNRMATAFSDDYSSMSNGRIIDKAWMIVYSTYVAEIQENVEIDDQGYIPVGTCKDFEGMIQNAIKSQMSGQISAFTAYIDPAQNILSTEKLQVKCTIRPMGILKDIDVELSFSNPALSNA